MSFNQINISLYNKNEYLLNFMNELSYKKESNKSSKDIINMSYKRPIPMVNYDYSLFNFFPKIYKEILLKIYLNQKITKKDIFINI